MLSKFASKIDKKVVYNYSKNGHIFVLIASIVGFLWGVYNLIRTTVIANVSIGVISGQVSILNLSYENPQLLERVFRQIWGYGMLGILLSFTIIFANLLIVFNSKNIKSAKGILVGVLFIFICDFFHINMARNLTNNFNALSDVGQGLVMSFAHSPLSFGNMSIFNWFVFVAFFLYYLMYFKGLLMNIARYELA